MVVLLLQLFALQAQALTAPGTSIQNRAELTYVDGASGEAVSVLSNLSLVSVGQYYDLSLQQDLRLRAQAGAVVSFPHVLTNTGNTPDSYRIFVSADTSADLAADDASPDQEQQSPSDLLQNDSPLPLANVAIYVDDNGNGLLDDGEPVLGTTRVLVPAESLNIVVLATVPAGVLPGSELSFQLHAESVGETSLSRFVTDVIDIETGPVINITKDTYPVCEVLLFPGDTVTHTLRVENTGSAAPAGIRHVLSLIHI